jgi:hypothetical protein
MSDLIDILNDSEKFSRFSPEDKTFQSVDDLLKSARDTEEVLYGDPNELSLYGNSSNSSTGPFLSPDGLEDNWLMKTYEDEIERVEFKNLKEPLELFEAAGKGRAFECPITNNIFVGYDDSAHIYDDNDYKMVDDSNCRISSSNKKSIVRTKSIATSDQKVSFPDLKEIQSEQLNLGTIKLKKEGQSWHRKVKSSIITVRYHDGPQWSGLVVIISDIEGLHYTSYANEFFDKRMKIKLNLDYSQNAEGIPLNQDDTENYINQVKIADQKNITCMNTFYSLTDFTEFTGSGRNPDPDYKYLNDLESKRTNLVKARYGLDLMETF